MTTFTPEVVMWEWRDGSIHPEMRLTSFFIEDSEAKLVTHLDGPRFASACGLGYFGKSHATGLGNPAKIDCPACRKILRGLCMVPSQDPGTGAS